MARMPERAVPLLAALILGCLAHASCSHAHSHSSSSSHPTAPQLSSQQIAHGDQLAAAGQAQISHPFQSWLHGYLRGIGKEMSAAGGRPGTHLAGDLIRKPLLHPEQIILSHTSLNETDGEGGGEEAAGGKEPQEIDINSHIYMDEGEFARHAEDWMQENRTLVEFCIRWMLLGGFIFLAATGLLCYSEIRMVYLTREIDDFVVQGKQMDNYLKWKKDKVENWRGYMTFGACFFLVVSLCMVLFPLCRMATSLLLSMGYVFNGCYLLAFTYAFLVAIIWALFVTGLCWSCTRPWTAAILIILALLGQGALDSGAAPALVLWVIFALLVGWVWLKWGKSLVQETPYTDEEKQRLMPSDP